MLPDDPRHGTYAGAVAHWFDKERPCAECARAEARYRKTRKLRHLHGDSPTVPSIGTVRRYQALLAIGWTGPQIAEATGISINSLRSIDYHGSEVVQSKTAQAVAETYGRLCMTRPDGPYSDRTRALAARRGWPPPLAWCDIDDPNEDPTGWAYQPERSTRREVLTQLDAEGAGITAACKRLHITRESLQKWCGNNGMSNVYLRLGGREITSPMNRGNQYTGRAA